MAVPYLSGGSGGRGPRRALIYARTGPHGSGPPVELQLAAAAAHARLSGFEPVGEAVDEGVSGGIQPFSRAGLGSAVSTLSEGEAEALAVSAVDRISGDAAVVAPLVDCARLDGWTLLVPGVAECSTPAGRFAVTVLCALKRLADDAAAVSGPGGVRLASPPEHHAAAAVSGPGVASANDASVVPGPGQPGGAADTAAQSGFSLPVSDPGPRGSTTGTPVARIPLPVAPHTQSALSHPGSYLGVWIRAIGESAAGMSIVDIARSLNADGMPLSVGLIAEGHAEWKPKSVLQMVEWPEGADLLERALAEGEQGRTSEQIALGFNADGMSTRRGRAWSSAAVTALLAGRSVD